MDWVGFHACSLIGSGWLALAGAPVFLLACSRTPLASYEPASDGRAVPGAGRGGGSSNAHAAGDTGAGGAGGDRSASAGASGAAGLGFGDACARTTNHVQGSRLRARTVVTDEGDRTWIGWHDSVLDVDCTFYETEEGVSRCLPDETASARMRYVDGACTEPLLVVTGASLGIPGPVRVLEAQGCTHYYAHYERGPEVQAPGVLYEVDIFSGQCNAGVSSAPAFSLGPKEDLSEYVRGEVRQVTTHRLVTDAIVASDGTYQVARHRDTANDVECAFLPGPDGVERCWPAAAVYDEGYSSDAHCEGELLRGHACFSHPGLARVNAVGECPSASRVVAHGDPYPGRVYEAAESAACAEVSAADLPPLFEPEHDVAAETFQVTDLTILESDPGRLKPRHRTTEDGFCAFEGWWDSRLREPCRFLGLSDGEYRCLPGDISRYVSRYFRDANCTEETRLAEAPACPERSDYAYVVVDQGLGPDGGREVYRVVRRTRPSALWKQAEDGTCATVAGNELVGLVEVGMPIDADEFVGGSVTVE
jgi:hypothetical protein